MQLNFSYLIFHIVAFRLSWSRERERSDASQSPNNSQENCKREKPADRIMLSTYFQRQKILLSQTAAVVTHLIFMKRVLYTFSCKQRNSNRSVCYINFKSAHRKIREFDKTIKCNRDRN